MVASDFTLGTTGYANPGTAGRTAEQPEPVPNVLRLLANFVPVESF